MLGKTTYPAQIARACQHKDTITLSYRSASEKMTPVIESTRNDQQPTAIAVHHAWRLGMLRVLHF